MKTKLPSDYFSGGRNLTRGGRSEARSLSDILNELSFNFTTVFYADSNNTEQDQDGSAEKPFSSLQAALTAISSLPKLSRKMILVAPGSAFDEDVNVYMEELGHISIMGLGPWTIGDAAGASYASTVARNLNVIQGKTALDASTRYMLAIGTLLDSETSSTHVAYGCGLDISGGLNITDPDNAQLSHEYIMNNVKVRGNLIATDSAAGKNFYLRRCFFDLDFTTTAGLLWIADSCEFDGLITVQQYCRITQCEITAGMNAAGGINAALPPAGIFFSTLSGVFTGPAGSIKLDGVSNYFFNLNGATLAGGATRVLLHDSVIV